MPFFQDRKLFESPPRLLLVHTNSARRQGDIESAWNHSNANPGRNTLPHYQVDRDGRARKMCPSDRHGIANATVSEETKIILGGGSFRFPWKTLKAEWKDEILAHGNVQDWSLAIETADTGTDDDRTISAFTEIQAEMVAQIIAFESIAHGFPIEFPSAWHGAGVASHCEPFGYPYWTSNLQHKGCPGPKKQAQVRDVIMPRAQEIKDVWHREASIVVDTGRLQVVVGDPSEVSIPVSETTLVASVLDQIYFAISNVVLPFTYGESWILEYASGDPVPEIGTGWARRHGVDIDSRTIQEVGIAPGAV